MQRQSVRGLLHHAVSIVLDTVAAASHQNHMAAAAPDCFVALMGSPAALLSLRFLLSVQAAELCSWWLISGHTTCSPRPCNSDSTAPARHNKHFR
jgi:hypothetical protein